ncbi:MAG: hypothetical protein AABZ06_04685, partial [Bdellovibrionota bacterium]
MRAIFLLLATCLMLYTAGAAADEFHELYRGARAQAMGNAYVGLADDEQAIFLNPAGLAGNKSYSLHYMISDTDFSTDVLTAAIGGINMMKNLSGDSLNVIMGKNVYGREQLSPTFIMPNFGMAVLVDAQTALLAKNQALPHITIGYQITNGFQLGWATSIGSRRRRDSDFRIGIGAKMLWRRGGYRVLTLNQLLTLSSSTLAEITGDYGRGYGVDLGSQWLKKINPHLFMSVG